MQKCTVYCSYIGQIHVYNSNSILKVQVGICMQPISPAEDKSTLLIVTPTDFCLVLYLLAPLGVAMFKLLGQPSISALSPQASDHALSSFALIAGLGTRLHRVIGAVSIIYLPSNILTPDQGHVGRIPFPKPTNL